MSSNILPFPKRLKYTPDPLKEALKVLKNQNGLDYLLLLSGDEKENQRLKMKLYQAGLSADNED